jgi:hypothetical protein
MATAPLAGAAGAASGAPDNVAKARALAEEAGDLLDSKKYAEALDRVTKAESLYHAPTHELMLGQANEGLGHLALALSLYEKLAAEPIPPSAPRAFVEAQQSGKQRLSALLSRVPSLLVVVSGHAAGGAAPDVTIDGEAYSVESGAAKPADPGPHAVVVRVAGRDPIQKSVVLPDKGGVVTLEVSVGADKSDDRTTTSLPAPVFLPAALREDAGSSAPPKDSGASQGRGSLVPALVGFGVGVVGLGLGAVTGALSMSKVSDIKSQCPGNRCPASEQSNIDSAKSLGTVSTVGFIVGGVGVAAGTVLLLLRSPSRDSQPAAANATVTPWIGIGTCGVDATF